MCRKGPIVNQTMNFFLKMDSFVKGTNMKYQVVDKAHLYIVFK